MTGQTCEFPRKNANDAEIRDILKHFRTVAVVGLSRSPDKASHQVAAYLKEHGYRIIPVNPQCTSVLDETCYASLLDIPGKVDVVDIFRPPVDVPFIVAEAIEKGAKVIWMQQGIVHNAAADKARAAGLKVVMDRCMKVEHARLAEG